MSRWRKYKQFFADFSREKYFVFFFILLFEKMATNDAMETEPKKVYASSLTQALNEERKYTLEIAPQTDETKDFLARLTINSQTSFLNKNTTTRFLARLTQNFDRHNEEELESDLELFHQFFVSSDLDQRLHYLYEIGRAHV